MNKVEKESVKVCWKGKIHFADHSGLLALIR